VHPRKLSTGATASRGNAKSAAHRIVAQAQHRKIVQRVKKALTFAAKIARPDNPA
jgi:hypothetical protein